MAAVASGHYHFSVEGVGRGSGAPVMAKAAYRSGECLFDERTGQFHDYRGGAERVIDSFVMARENAPAWMQHAAREVRLRAWNEAERAEPRANGRIATEIVVGLPHELTDAQRKELLSFFVLRIVEKHGVFADVSIHTAHDDRNIHAHILLSHRELGPDGFGEIANTRYENRKRKGEMVREKVAGIAATPSAIKGLREQWAQDVNRAYAEAGLNIRVDHRSFEDRGLKDVPTIHLGPKATAAERRGYRTDRGDTNRIIAFGNAELGRLEDEARRQDAEIIDLQERYRRKWRVEFQNENILDPKVQQKEVDDQRAMIDEAARRVEFAEQYRARIRQDQEEADERKRARQQKSAEDTKEGDIADARGRELKSLGGSDGSLRSMAEAVAREGSMFQREQDARRREMVLEKDPDKRQAIDLKRKIEAAEYFAITSDRLKWQSRIITGRSDSAESQRQEQRHDYFVEQAAEHRKELQEVNKIILAKELTRIQRRADQLKHYQQNPEASWEQAGQHVEPRARGKYADLGDGGGQGNREPAPANVNTQNGQQRPDTDFAVDRQARAMPPGDADRRADTRDRAKALREEVTRPNAQDDFHERQRRDYLTDTRQQAAKDEREPALRTVARMDREQESRGKRDLDTDRQRRNLDTDRGSRYREAEQSASRSRGGMSR